MMTPKQTLIYPLLCMFTLLSAAWGHAVADQNLKNPRATQAYDTSLFAPHWTAADSEQEIPSEWHTSSTAHDTQKSTPEEKRGSQRKKQKKKAPIKKDIIYLKLPKTLQMPKDGTVLPARKKHLDDLFAEREPESFSISGRLIIDDDNTKMPKADYLDAFKETIKGAEINIKIKTP